MIAKVFKNENNYNDESLDFKKYSKKYKKNRYLKKKGNKCYCLNMLEKIGPINIINIPKTSKIYISKMELVEFNDHFNDLLEKGKIFQSSQLNDNNKKSIPSLSFWYQRYYYYSKYDEGIMMDNESNSIFI
jgi:hypothetical protein